MSIADKHGESAKRILEWFSPVDPLIYHQAARTIHQRGTGRWFIHGPEFLNWQATPNSALWVYGILLSSLKKSLTSNLPVLPITTVLRDTATQRPIHILGSLIRQLAEQNEDVFSDCRSFHAKHNPAGRPPSLPTEAELGELLQEISQHFIEVSLVLDGLDECGAAAGIDRMELTRVLSELHEPSKSTIRIAIASRKEQDIATYLDSFTSISIAAMSSDLELYIEAEVARRGRGKIRDPNLRDEIVDALSNGAEGMLQWVKCQLDYLFTLPNDVERRKALRSLPPDLPQAYIRILERLDRDLSPATQRLVRRVLVWLSFETNYQGSSNHHLIMEIFTITVSMSIDGTKTSPDSLPLPSDTSSWCSSLIRVDEATNLFTFSHFSVREFLLSEAEAVSSSIARKYLVRESRDTAYMADVCLTQLTSSDVPLTLDFESDKAIKKFDEKFPFYAHAAYEILSYLNYVDGTAEEFNSLQKFFTPLNNCNFTLWHQYIVSTKSFEASEISWPIVKAHQHSNRS